MGKMHGIITTSGEPDAKFFSITETKPTKKINPAEEFSPTDFSIVTTQLQNGDLMRVFNSIAKGERLFQFKIDFERGDDYQQYQRGVNKNLWASLFNLELPAKLQREDGTIIDGNLMSFLETGMEGRPDWILFDFAKKSYESAHWLKDGDILTVFSHVTNGNIEWQGRLEFENQPLITGKKTMLFSFDEAGKLHTRDVDDIFIKKPVKPDLATWEDFSLYRRPATVVRCL